MLAAVLTALLIVAASLFLGAAVMAFSQGGPGREAEEPPTDSAHSPVTPAVGLAVLLVVCGIAVKLPGHAEPAAIAVAVALVGAGAILSRWGGKVGRVRAGAILAALAAALIAAVPFIVNGRMGILGVGLVNDDMASHLLFADWLDARIGETPELVADGYPLGPHAVVAAAAKVTGASLVEAFAGLTFALAALFALTAYGALPGLGRWARAPAAVLATFPYLATAYLVQGAFKEPMLALMLVGFALALPGLGGSPLRAVPLGAIAAGTLYLYSFPGFAWLAGAALAWWVIGRLRERAETGSLAIGKTLRAAAPAVVVAIAIPVVAALPEAGTLAQFVGFGAFDPQGNAPEVGLGNLPHSISPLEALGVWPSSEFRTSAADAGAPAIVFYAGGLVAIAALAWGLMAAARRREWALPAALAAAAVVYLGALAFGTPYTNAKALAIAAPVVMLIALGGLLGGRYQGAEEADRPTVGVAGTRLPAAIPALLAIAFLAGTAVSSLLPLRQAPVSVDHHAEELARMRPLVQDKRVLFLGRDDFAAWELLGARVLAPIVNNYNVDTVPSTYPPTADSAKFEFDAVPPRVLDGFRFVITTSAAHQSEAPPAFQPRLRTGDYVLWEQKEEGKRGDPGIANRRTLPEPTGPGAVLDCSTPEGRVVAGTGGSATAFALAPVSAPATAWSPSSNVTDSRPATAELELEPGRWSISLQYVATQTAHVRAPGFKVDLDANLDFRGPSAFWPVGEIEVEDRGRVPFEVSVDEPTWAGRLIGAEGLAYLGPIAASPAGPRERIPVARACGRYVDWYSSAANAETE